jgi:hypothetical protein
LSVELYQPLRDFEGVSDEQLQRNLDRYSGTVSLEIFNGKTPESPLATARAAMHAMLLVEQRARGSNERKSSKPGAAGASKP